LRLSTEIQRFNTQLQADGKSEHTRGAYLRDLQRFRSWLHKDREVASITPDTLARFCASGSCTDRQTISINHTKTALRMFFGFLTDAGHIKTNPARFIRNHRSDPRPPEHVCRRSNLDT
jgi:site-specific recombinase XerD